MTSQRRWARALDDHTRAVEAFVSAIASLPADAWHDEPSPGKWSAAAVTLHLIDAYELGCRAATGGSSMRLVVPPWRARILRTVLLPILIIRGRFPRARAPREVRPDVTASLTMTRPAATERLRSCAAEAAAAFRAADSAPNPRRFTHAYFGPLPPYRALRMLTAHTQHHTRTLSNELTQRTTRSVRTEASTSRRDSTGT